ncbi:MAG: putative toxin-antitoxin system toxin component, PIN family [Stellaceae bacterium]
MRAVVDTNVLVSGLLWHGAPHTLLEQVRAGVVTLISSPALLAEFAEVLARPKFQAIMARSGIAPARVLAELRQLAELFDPPSLPVLAARDPDDDAVLALAVASRADLIISGDADLLTLGAYADIPIVGPAAAIARIGR